MWVRLANPARPRKQAAEFIFWLEIPRSVRQIPHHHNLVLYKKLFPVLKSCCWKHAQWKKWYCVKFKLEWRFSAGWIRKLLQLVQIVYNHKEHYLCSLYLTISQHYVYTKEYWTSQSILYAVKIIISNLK